VSAAPPPPRLPQSIARQHGPDAQRHAPRTLLRVHPLIRKRTQRVAGGRSPDRVDIQCRDSVGTLSQRANPCDARLLDPSQRLGLLHKHHILRHGRLIAPRSRQLGTPFPETAWSVPLLLGRDSSACYPPMGRPLGDRRLREPRRTARGEITESQGENWSQPGPDGAAASD